MKEENNGKTDGKNGNLSEKLSGWFRRENLIVLILLGVLCVIVALPVKKESTTGQTISGITAGTALFESMGNTESLSAGGTQNMVETDAAATVNAAIRTSDTENYVTYLEEKLASMLEETAGLSDVDVMITLKTSEEQVVEKDMTAERSATEERDSVGGTRSQNSSRTEYATIGQNGTGGSPFVVKTIPPQVEGVLIVAKGAGRGDMTTEITQTVQALFGIEAHKVKVLEK